MRALVVVLLVACGGSKPPAPAPVSNATPPPAVDAPAAPAADRAGGLIAKMSTYRDRMCACKDKPCAEQVNEEFTRWLQDMAKNAESEKATATNEEDAKRLADGATQYQECYMKLATPTP